eukprot:3564167-Pleurochrysis_carterae.AAC.1
MRVPTFDAHSYAHAFARSHWGKTALCFAFSPCSVFVISEFGPGLRLLYQSQIGPVLTGRPASEARNVACIHPSVNQHDCAGAAAQLRVRVVRLAPDSHVEKQLPTCLARTELVGMASELHIFIRIDSRLAIAPNWLMSEIQKQGLHVYAVNVEVDHQREIFQGRHAQLLALFSNPSVRADMHDLKERTHTGLCGSGGSGSGSGSSGSGCDGYATRVDPKVG